MPFPQQEPRPFTRANILALDPGQIGVYGIFRAGVWVYVGRGDIRERLLRHVGGDNPYITIQMPTHWVGEVTSNDVTREIELIRECNPVCNRRVG